MIKSSSLIKLDDKNNVINIAKLTYARKAHYCKVWLNNQKLKEIIYNNTSIIFDGKTLVNYHSIEALQLWNYTTGYFFIKLNNFIKNWLRK